MALQPLLLQLSRMLGREALVAALGSEPESVSALAPRQKEALERLVGNREEAFVEALVGEAADNDDVAGATSALLYGERRLEEFEGIVSPSERDRLLGLFRERTAGWG